MDNYVSVISTIHSPVSKSWRLTIMSVYAIESQWQVALYPGHLQEKGTLTHVTSKSMMMENQKDCTETVKQ